MTSTLTTFEYDDVEPELAITLRQSRERIRACAKANTVAILQIGRELLAVKRQLGHGKFTSWVFAECGFSPRTAANYMRAAAFADGKIATVADLSPAALYRVSAKNTPHEIAGEVLDQLELGRAHSDAEIELMIDTWRHSRRLINSPFQPGSSADEARRAADLAAVLLARLGPQFARDLIKRRELVCEKLQGQLDAQPQEQDEASLVDDAPQNIPKSQDLMRGADLERDSADDSVFRPKEASNRDEWCDLGIPEYLHRVREPSLPA